VSYLDSNHVVTEALSREDLRRPGPLLGLLAAVLALLAPVTARAEADVFGLGNGQHGNLTVRDPGFVINASTPLAAEAPAGTSELRVEEVSAFATGELVLVLQMGSDTALPGAQETEASVSLADSGAGRWELARLASIEPGVLRLTAPLVRRFASVSQVVRVPEYDVVRLSTTGTLVAPPWNGRTGGVLAFLATGTVFNAGALVADGAGFRGGAAEGGTSTQMGCEALNGPVGGGGASGGGALKGEGISSAAGATSGGYGRLGNGGGGGNCHDAGGGGGALGGKGGRGGHSAQEDGSRPVGGHGGAALGFEPQARLLLGGGGGAGHEGSAGGAGGGIIFLRAHEVQGPKPRGLITANGSTPLASSTGGAGGGGAGGSIHVRVERRLGCTVLEARGGAGGNSAISPGGGAGGGHLYLQSQGGVDPACIVSASAGLAGTISSGGGNSGAQPVSGSEADFAGVTVVIDQGFAVPAVPTWVTPRAGEVVSPLSPLEGKTAPGASVQVFLDGAPLGAPVVADAAGTFSVMTPAELPEGPHEARAWAEQLGARSALSAPLGFTVGELALRVGFGCGAAPGGAGGGLGALGLALLVWVGAKGVRRLVGLGPWG
jgi:hypothetical protein